MSEHERPSAVPGEGPSTTPAGAAATNDPLPVPPVAGARRDTVDAATNGDADGPADDVDHPDTGGRIDSAGAVEGAGLFGLSRDVGLDREVTTEGRSALLRPRNLALVSAGVAVVVLAAVLGPIAWERWNRDDVQVTTPSSVAGLVLDDSQGAHDTIDYLRTAIQTAVSLDRSTGAVYADETGESRSVLFVGGTGEIGSAENALTKTFQLISDDNGGVEHVRTLPAGPLGGVMQCGSTQTDGGPMAVCGWADRHSLGIAMFPNRPVDQSAELLRKMRAVMQEGH